MHGASFVYLGAWFLGTLGNSVAQFDGCQDTESVEYCSDASRTPTRMGSGRATRPCDDQDEDTQAHLARVCAKSCRFCASENTGPASCSDVRASDPFAEDGEYMLVKLQPNLYYTSVYCHDMQQKGKTPQEYLTLNSTNNYGAHIDVNGGVSRTIFKKVRLDLQSEQLDVTDLTFASQEQGGESLKLGSAYYCGCDTEEYPPLGAIDLTGTDFRIDRSETSWTARGVQPSVTGSDWNSGERAVSVS